MIMLSVIMLNVALLSVIILSVKAPRLLILTAFALSNGEKELFSAITLFLNHHLSAYFCF
jgi:hypothetical protein